MNHAPVDFIVVRFPGTDFSPEVAAGLGTMIQSGTIRIIDLLFLVKDGNGVTAVRELTDLEDSLYQGWDSVVDDVFGYLTEDDAMLLADSLTANSSAVLVLIENTWAREMVRTISAAHGDVLVSERIPRPVVEQLVMNH